MRRPALPLWPTPRASVGVLAIAVVLGCSAWLHALLAVAALLALVLAALVAADALLGPPARALRLSRAPVERATLGVPAPVRYALDNGGTAAVRARVLETPATAIDFAADELELAAAAGTTALASSAFTARERGPVELGDLHARVRNRVGLLERRLRAPAAETVVVGPDLSAADGARIASRGALLVAGMRRTAGRGAGGEFESLRDYEPGDAFRSIDWKATARRGRTTVARYEPERGQQVVVALDCGRAMTPRLGARRKLDYALAAGLAMLRTAQLAGDRVGIVAFAGRPLLRIAPRAGAAHYAAILRAAYDLQPRLEEPDAETTLATLRAGLGKRSLVVLFTDLVDPVASAAVLAGVAALSRRHLVVCALLSDAAVDRALAALPGTESQAFETAVAMTLADERARAVASLRALGAIVVDAPAADLARALQAAYLRIKARGRL